MTNPDGEEFHLASRELTVRLSCRWLGDRYQHHLQWYDGSQWHDLLTSNEGSSAEPWPVSPPIQELHRQPWQQRECLLGIGKAGTGHWSLSIEPLIDRTGFRFDVACRLDGQTTGASIGSGYDSTHYAACHSKKSEVENSAALELLPDSGDFPALLLVEVSGGGWSGPEDGTIQWKFWAEVPDVAVTQTARWVYELIVD